MGFYTTLTAQVKVDYAGAQTSCREEQVQCWWLVSASSYIKFTRTDGIFSIYFNMD